MNDLRLTVDTKTGKLHGNASIHYNHPFPCVNGSWEDPGTHEMGVVMHTMVCDLPECIRLFNTEGFDASADFGIAQDGTIHQFGPVGKGWVAWGEVKGNSNWYSIEHADHGNPDNPLTDAQILASAQLVECLSAFAGFKLQVSNDVNTPGYGTHFMGGAAWGGHSCPDLPPKHIRSRQRKAIIAKAKQIRSGSTRTVITVVSSGLRSLDQICAIYNDKPVRVIARTLANGHLHPRLVAYVAAHPLGRAPMPKGIHLLVATGKAA